MNSITNLDLRSYANTTYPELIWAIYDFAAHDAVGIEATAGKFGPSARIVLSWFDIANDPNEDIAYKAIDRVAAFCRGES